MCTMGGQPLTEADVHGSAGHGSFVYWSAVYWSAVYWSAVYWSDVYEVGLGKQSDPYTPI